MLLRCLGLEGELSCELEDARIESSGDVAEGAGVQRSCKGGTSSGADGGEVGMVEDVEGLETDGEGQTLMDGEAAAQCGVEADVVRGAEGVATEVAEGAGCVLREGCFVEIGEVSRRFLGDFKTGVDGLWIDQVGTVEADAGERVVDAGGDIERQSAGDAKERRDLPVVGQRAGPALEGGEVAGGY